MIIKTALFAVASIGLLASPLMAPEAGADTLKSCTAAWNGMAPADKAMTTHKAFLSSCKKGNTRQAAATRDGVAAVPDRRLAPLPCHDYSDCTTQEVIEDPK